MGVAWPRLRMQDQVQKQSREEIAALRVPAIGRDYNFRSSKSLRRDSMILLKLSLSPGRFV